MNLNELRTPTSRRHGYEEFGKDTIRKCPEMVEVVNQKGETLFYEACKQGQADVLLLLLDIDPTPSFELCHQNQSPMFVACINGFLDVVKVFLNHRQRLQILQERYGSLDSACFL